MTPGAVVYQPKGGMCMTCKHMLVRNCSNLPFHNMPMIRLTELVAIVRCTEHVKAAL